MKAIRTRSDPILFLGGADPGEGPAWWLRAGFPYTPEVGGTNRRPRVADEPQDAGGESESAKAMETASASVGAFSCPKPPRRRL